MRGIWRDEEWRVTNFSLSKGDIGFFFSSWPGRYREYTYSSIYTYFFLKHRWGNYGTFS